MKFPEYVIAFTSIPASVLDQDIIPAFQVFDTDKTGFLTADEMLKSLANIGEQLDEVETKAFKDSMTINEQGLFDYNGNKPFPSFPVSLSLRTFFHSLEFYLKFTQPPKPKRKKKGKKKKKGK